MNPHDQTCAYLERARTNSLIGRFLFIDASLSMELKMKIQATVNLNFPSEKRLKIVLGALGPETRISSTSRSKVHAEGGGNRLTLIFEARDTSALRAALNSYLRWIVVINDACSVMEDIEK